MCHQSSTYVQKKYSLDIVLWTAENWYEFIVKTMKNLELLVYYIFYAHMKKLQTMKLNFPKLFSQICRRSMYHCNKETVFWNMVQPHDSQLLNFWHTWQLNYFAQSQINWHWTDKSCAQQGYNIYIISRAEISNYNWMSVSWYM